MVLCFVYKIWNHNSLWESCTFYRFCIRAVYTCTRPCTRPRTWPLYGPYTAAYTAHYRAMSYTAVYCQCTRPVHGQCMYTARVHGRVHGPYMAVYTAHTRSSTRVHGRGYGPVYTTVYTPPPVRAVYTTVTRRVRAVYTNCTLNNKLLTKQQVGCHR